MARPDIFVTKDSELIEDLNSSVERRHVQESWPTEREERSWIMLVGDCLFTDMFRDFEDTGLHEADLPFIIAVHKGKLYDVIKYAETRIPPSTRMVIVHLGANNLASRHPGFETAHVLLRIGRKLCRDNGNIEEVALCLLSPRVMDKNGSFSKEYITQFNKNVVTFNKELKKSENLGPRFSIIDFGADKEHLPSVLRDSGFGVRDHGRKVVAESLSSLIKFKVNTSKDHGDLPENMVQPVDGRKRKPLVLRKNGDTAVGFYDTPHGQLRLSLEGGSTRSYPKSDIPQFMPLDGFECGKKRKAQSYHPADRNRIRKKPSPEGEP